MKHFVTKLFQYAWQAVFSVATFSLMIPEGWIGIPIILAAFFTLFDFVTPKKYMTAKQNRIMLAICLPIGMIALTILGIHNLNAGLYNAGHAASLAIILIQLAASAASIFRPHNPLVKLFRDPNMEIK